MKFSTNIGDLKDFNARLVDMKLIFCMVFIFLVNAGFGQNISLKLEQAIQKLELDSQMKHGIISLYVVNSKTGVIIYRENSEVGLAPASCQKVVTSVSAFELLGKDYKYSTKLAYSGKAENGYLYGNICILGSGDPTLGSWRYPSTQEKVILSSFKNACKELAPNGIKGYISTNATSWGEASTPDGWIWQDIGNYYGAGATVLNWRENQYDIILKSGKKVGDSVSIVGTNPGNLYGITFINKLTSAEVGSGDNGYIYLAPKSLHGYLMGTIPVNQDHFIISGALPDPASLLKNTFQDRAIITEPNIFPNSNDTINLVIFYTHYSPPLDSINYWFFKKSINLYGEALLKTIAFQKTSHGETDSGVSVVRKFWNERGIEPSALKIIDGCGLSPGNRVTTSALVAIMQYARDKSWFSSFYYDLPEINGIKMKDGYINGVRSYTGYIKDHNGNEYTFSFIINNFDGSPSTMREKMWKVLDVMK